MRVLEVLVWWASLTAVWAVLASSPTGAELLVGAVVALPCAVLALRCRTALGVRWRFRARWVAWAVPLVVGVVVDSTILLTRTLLRRGEPTAPVRVELPRDPDEQLAEGRHAASSAALASTPSTVVIDDSGVINDSGVRNDEGAGDGGPHLLLHPLDRGSGALRRTVQR